MKLHTLMIAVALAAGTAFAQAPNGTAKAPVDQPTANATAGTGAKAMAKKHHKVAKKSHAHRHMATAKHHAKHASAKPASAKHHAKHAQAHARHPSSKMGASAASSDLNASTRQARMDASYGNWRAKR